MPVYDPASEELRAQVLAELGITPQAAPEQPRRRRPEATFRPIDRELRAQVLAESGARPRPPARSTDGFPSPAEVDALLAQAGARPAAPSRLLRF